MSDVSTNVEKFPIAAHFILATLREIGYDSAV
jgi:hypothetical protein